MGTLLVYALGGYFAGVLRRLFGFVALYAGLFAGTHMGLQAGLILQQTSNFETPDSRIYGFFGILFAVLLIVEVGTPTPPNPIPIPPPRPNPPPPLAGLPRTPLPLP